MTRLEQKLRTALRRLNIGAESALLVAVSGGADSVALLDALLQLRRYGQAPQTILAAHLNHQLRGDESDGDENFVRALAAKLAVNVVVDSIAVGAQALAERQNLEATARRLRYEFLTRAAESCGAQFVCTAHTQNDQAETVLMRLLRGAGAEGLRGIYPSLQLTASIKLIRPMLSVSRTEVIEHCRYRNLEFRTDSSNFSLEFTRNRIRQELMPLLRGFNPRLDETLARTAGLLSEDQEFLEQTAAEALAAAQVEAELDAKLLRAYPPTIQRRMLRLWLRKQRGLQRIEAVHLAAVESLVVRGAGGRTVELPGGWQVRLKSGKLRLAKAETEGRI